MPPQITIIIINLIKGNFYLFSLQNFVFSPKTQLFDLSAWQKCQKGLKLILLQLLETYDFWHCSSYTDELMHTRKM